MRTEQRKYMPATQILVDVCDLVQQSQLRRSQQVKAPSSPREMTRRIPKVRKDDEDPLLYKNYDCKACTLYRD